MPRRPGIGLTATAVLCLGLQGSAAPVFPAGFLAAFRWVTDDPRLGGLSAIEVSEDGSRFVVLSDRGAVTEGRFERDAEGRITGIEAAPMHLLRGKSDAPLQRGRSDSEGLAQTADGRLYVSFEGVARVLEYQGVGASARNLPRPDAFGAFPENASLEALAIAPDGRLFTLPERSDGETAPFPVWVFDGSWSQPYAIARDAGFLPVGADFGPDGRFYLLERNFLGLGGFASRVRAFAPGPDGLGPGEVLFQTMAGTHDNLEGLSVWRDSAGDIRLTMVSDDNFQFYLRQEVVEYILPGPDRVDVPLPSH